ncbi:MAG TPA: hypothetical protein VKC54_01405 [Patescibacteria group bacterium]|nr:hypothetical protein [Patescibacteria group bacterium]
MSWEINAEHKPLFAEFLFGRLFAGWPITTDEFHAFSGCDEGKVQKIISDCISEFGFVELPPTTPPKWHAKPQYGLPDLNKLDTSRLGEYLGLTSAETIAYVVKIQGQIEGFLGNWKERNR